MKNAPVKYDDEVDNYSIMPVSLRPTGFFSNRYQRKINQQEIKAMESQTKVFKSREEFMKSYRSAALAEDEARNVKFEIEEKQKDRERTSQIKDIQHQTTLKVEAVKLVKATVELENTTKEAKKTDAEKRQEKIEEAKRAAEDRKQARQLQIDEIAVMATQLADVKQGISQRFDGEQAEDIFDTIDSLIARREL